MKKFMALCACALFAVGLTACGGSNTDTGATNADFATVQTAVKDAIVSFLEDNGVTPAEENGEISGFMTYDIASDDVKALYPTLADADFANGTIYMPLMMTNGDLVIIAEAKDADAVAAVQTAFEGVKEAQIQTWQQYLPEQFEKVQNNQIVTSGNFVLYSTFSDNSVVKAFEAATK